MSSINESTLNRLIESANISLKGNETAEEKLNMLKECGLLLKDVELSIQTIKTNSLILEARKIGILFSSTGATATAEIPMRMIYQAAIDEIDFAGFPFVPIFADYRSNDIIAGKLSEQLIREYNCDALFGCWTSAARKAVIPICQKYNKPLFYPVQYEGCESSPYVFYHGATANQQLVPAVTWVNESGRNNVYLVGSDYVFPRTANKIIRNYTEHLGGKILGERYVPLTYNGDFSDIMNDIVRNKPTCIHNTLNGSANTNFFRALQSIRQLLPENFTVMSYSIAENDIRNIGPQLCAGYYTAWDYYMSLDTKANQNFASSMRIVYGDNTLTDAPSNSGYSSVYAFMKLLFESNLRTNLDELRNGTTRALWQTPIGSQDYNRNQHVYMDCRIGQILPSGQIQRVTTYSNIEPDPCLRGYSWASGICPNACD